MTMLDKISSSKNLIEDFRKEIIDMFGKEMSSSKFIWNNSVRANQISYTEYMIDYDRLKLKPGCNYEGWCDSSNLSVLQREGIAIMVSITGEEYWYHIPTDGIETLLRRYYLNKKGDSK